MTRASRRSKKRRKIIKRKVNIRGKWKASKESQAIISPKVVKYWRQRYSLFSRYDEGIKMDEEGWFSVTPEEIAVRHAQRCVAGGVVVDCFAGMGGNSIQFAALGYHVVAIDIDPQKVEMASNNAKIYGVDNYIDFIVADFLQVAPSLKKQFWSPQMPVYKGNVAFLSPPWGGPSYKMADNFTLDLLKPVDGYTLFQVAQTITPNIIMFLPRNVDVCQVEELSWLSSPPLNIEENYVQGYLKGMTAYFGNTAYWGVTEETTSHNIHEV
ncbi:trimethylguanosine synthase-like isoform X2 [Cynara cardunculus var. scolymus]|uniref:trimethylguanosine synthase-like isoform X2 n=1 Tax=Cynara cardunculus var. scolymus TaxID=59895 RepID=UPI000D62F39D|nr:trimethylguanosine synthase-like isoform X2 [Cynara cardunculus var. scolymus]